MYLFMVEGAAEICQPTHRPVPPPHHGRGPRCGAAELARSSWPAACPQLNTPLASAADLTSVANSHWLLSSLEDTIIASCCKEKVRLCSGVLNCPRICISPVPNFGMSLVHFKFRKSKRKSFSAQQIKVVCEWQSSCSKKWKVKWWKWEHSNGSCDPAQTGHSQLQRRYIIYVYNINNYRLVFWYRFLQGRPYFPHNYDTIT